MARMRISPENPTAAMTVFDAGLKSDKLVYVIVASRNLAYPRGRSPIAYIGSTENGIGRMANSAASKAPEVLALHGVKTFDVYPISSHGRPGAKKWWRKLERAFILAFLEEYGATPKLNSQGKMFRRTNEFELFSEEVVKGIITRLETGKPRRKS
jgi:hypothetical protein